MTNYLLIMLRMMLLGLTTQIMYCGAQTGSVICSLHSTFRPPADSDITVACGNDTISISILLCPIYYGGYDEFLMALNGRFNVPACHGIADFEADPPVLMFNFSISKETMTLCGYMLTITDQQGVDQLAGVQFANISGSIMSWDPSEIPITYHKDLEYQFSCQYPQQYLLNKTEVSITRMSISVRDIQGSFISTLSMSLFTNQQYTQPLQIPDGGLQLKTRIYVQVKATNLTNRLNVMLDRCYATTRPFPTNSTYYDLFAGCTRDGQTMVDVNGVSQEARFSFEAFRFLEHNNMTVSTFYLHCVTRLCENSTCSSMLQNCVKKVKRELQSSQYPSKVETVSSGPIKTRVDSGGPSSTSSTQSDSSISESNDGVAGVAILTFLLSVCTTGLVVLIMVYRSRNASPIIS